MTRVPRFRTFVTFPRDHSCDVVRACTGRSRRPDTMRSPPLARRLRRRQPPQNAPLLDRAAYLRSRLNGY